MVGEGESELAFVPGMFEVPIGGAVGTSSVSGCMSLKHGIYVRTGDMNWKVIIKWMMAFEAL